MMRLQVIGKFLGLFIGMTVASVLVTVLGGAQAWAAASKLYDMTRFLNEPYPLTRGAAPPPQYQPQPQYQPRAPAPRSVQAQRAPAPVSAPPVPVETQSSSILGSDWKVTLGAGVGFKNQYMGADDYEVTGFPIVGITWRDMVFLNNGRGLGFKFKPFRDLSTGPMANYSFDQDADGSISALDDVEGGFEAGWFLDYAIDPFVINLDVVQGVSGDNDGLLVTAGVDYTTKLGRNWQLGIRPSISFATEDYMDAFFGVNAAEAARSAFAFYKPDAGFRDMTVAFRLIYAWTRNWRVIGLVKTGYLLGEAADSPIVDVIGNAFQLSAGLGVAYKF